MATGKRRILVIDDEVGFTALLKLNLEKTGRFEIRTENDGTRSFQAARDFRPDLVLLDVVMPGMDGGEVLAQLRADDKLKQIPVIFLTATMSPEAVAARSGAVGGIPFVAKPVDLKKLIRLIEDTMQP